MHPIAVKATAIMLALPKAHFPEGELPETQTERESRIGSFVADVVERAEIEVERTGLTLPEMVALPLAFAYNESALAWEVHAGQPWPGRPAPFGDKGRAACLFQLQPSASQVPFAEWRPFERDQWSQLAGLDPRSTELCATAGVKAVAWHVKRCRHKIDHARSVGDDVWVGAVIASQYHRPNADCFGLSKGSVRRGKLYRTILYRLRFS